MKNIYSLILALGLASIAFGQQMPLDFSSNSDAFNVWGGAIFNFAPSPTDTNNSTGEFFKTTYPNEQGFFVDLSTPIDLDTEDEITLRFYAFDANPHTVSIKLEQGTNPDVEVQQTLTSDNIWTDMTFDFASVAGTGQYSRLVIRIDDGSSTAGTFRIDDINDGSLPGDDNPIDVVYTDLVWSDEFDGNALDTSKWHHQTFGPNGGQWYNGEQQHYTNSPTNSFVSNGNLHIVAKKETTSQNGVTLLYTSARLNSKYAFTYGRVDVKAKLPFGEGTWPAIWTLGKNITEPGSYFETQGFGTTSWPGCGEIDIMEHGLHALNEISWAIHTPSSYGATVNNDQDFFQDVHNNYHVYSMNWSPNQITFLVDGVAYYTYNPAVKDDNTWPFDLDQFLLLNVAMGGVSGAIDPNFVESAMVIDYVRVYQNVLDTDGFAKNDVKVYPNPTSDRLFIESDTDISKLQLFDMLGREVYSSSEHVDFISVNSLNIGVYILKIEGENGVITKKVMVE